MNKYAQGYRQANQNNHQNTTITIAIIILSVLAALTALHFALSYVEKKECQVWSEHNRIDFNPAAYDSWQIDQCAYHNIDLTTKQ